MKKTYLVISPIKCGGKKYPVGSTIALEDGEAAKLREAIGDEVAAQGGGRAPADDAARIAAIAEAIGKLDKEDASLWKKDGAPNTAAIVMQVGFEITAAERDAAWAQVKPAA